MGAISRAARVLGGGKGSEGCNGDEGEHVEQVGLVNAICNAIGERNRMSAFRESEAGRLEGMLGRFEQLQNSDS